MRKKLLGLLGAALLFASYAVAGSHGSSGGAGTASALIDDILGCDADEFYRRDATDVAWTCAAVAGGGDALVANTLTQFAPMASTNLLGEFTDETGTGVAVFSISPALTTPNLGTPSALVATNATGTAAGLTAGTCTTNANLTGDVTSSGNATTIADNSVDGTDMSLASEVAGDVMYYNGTDWIRLAKGTAGQVLEMNAGATAPEWDADDGSGTIGGSTGATDNAIMRADETGGATVQASLCTISDVGVIDCPDQTAEPGNGLVVRDNDTAFTNDPTCANSGTAGTLTLLDKDESSADDYVACTGTSELIDFNGIASAQLVAANKTLVCDFNVEAPLTGDDGVFQCYLPNAATLVRVYCNATTGTSVIQLYERAEATPSTGTTEMLTGDLTCDTDGASTTSFADAAVAADGLLALGLQTTFTVGTVRVHVEYTVN